MFHMIARFEAADGVREELLGRLKEMERLTQGEPGCVYYELNVDRDNMNIFYVREAWESAGDLALHDQTAHVRAIRDDEKRFTKDGISVRFMQKP